MQKGENKTQNNGERRKYTRPTAPTVARIVLLFEVLLVVSITATAMVFDDWSTTNIEIELIGCTAPTEATQPATPISL